MSDIRTAPSVTPQDRVFEFLLTPALYLRGTRSQILICASFTPRQRAARSPSRKRASRVSGVLTRSLV